MTLTCFSILGCEPPDEVFFVIILAWMVEQTLEWLRRQIPRVIRMLAHPVNLIL